MKLTQDQLDEWLQKWQKTLRLLDWECRIELKRGFDMGSCEGRNTVTRERKMAAITIADPDDFSAKPTWEPDPEHSLVHELIHCHIRMPDEKDSCEYIAMEQAIDALATAFVKLDRSKSRS